MLVGRIENPSHKGLVRGTSHQQFGHHLAVYVGQAVVPPLEAECQPRVVKTEQVQNRRLQIMDVNAIGDGGVTQLVRRAEVQSRLHTGAGEPDGGRLDVMIAADRAAVLAHGLVKEREVPPREIQEAIRRKRKFELDPERHTYKES